MIALFEAVIREAVSDFDAGEERRAAKWAKRKHDDTGAKRKASGDDYWVHPEGCAKIAKAYGASRQEILACMAHDTVEDAGATIEDIEDRFGSQVAEIVAECTNDPIELERQGKETYLNLKMEFMSPRALTVKLCDVLYNMTDRPKPDQRERMMRNVRYMAQSRELTPLHRELLSAISTAYKKR